MTSRLERFREVFSRLDPAKSYERVATLYVPPPGRPASDQLAMRLQLSPRSAHLLVGGIGTGKSTQLHRTAELLAQTGDTRAVYIDVSIKHDLTTDLTGVLTVLSGLELTRLVESPDSDVTFATRRFRQWADGYSVWVPYEQLENEYGDDPGDYEPGDVVHTPGVLKPPSPPMRELQQERVTALETLLKSLPKTLRHFIVLIDSLDRLPNIDAFATVAEDIRVLRAAGVGIAVVGPTRLLYGANRTFMESFEQVITMPPLDVLSDISARMYLLDVLSKRLDPSIVNPDAQLRLVEWSGGFVRDLLELARTAVEESFISGSETVSDEHISKAVDVLGRTLMLGLDAEDLSRLQKLRKTGTFVRVDNRDLELLTSRRIVEYQYPVTVYRVHPALIPLLAALESQS